MARRHSGRALKGSQYHLENLVNDSSGKSLSTVIISNTHSLSVYAVGQPEWRSPLASENYREYMGSDFLGLVKLSHLRFSLSDFWPRPGPYWDGLATVPGGKGGHGVILVEAKSHFKELSNQSYACGARGKGLQRIKASLAIVKRILAVKKNCDWLGRYYQYANRLAHLFWLNEKGVPVWMVFLYFIGDQEQDGPGTDFEWRYKLNEMKLEMGLPKRHALSDRIIELFVPVPQEHRAKQEMSRCT